MPCLNIKEETPAFPKYWREPLRFQNIGGDTPAFSKWRGPLLFQNGGDPCFFKMEGTPAFSK